MKWVRSVVARLPWVALGVGVGSIWVARDAVTPVAPAPMASDPAGTDPGRDRRVGAALALVRPGMTRREAEAILRPPHLVRPQQVTGSWRT